MEIRKPNIVAEFKRPPAKKLTPNQQKELNITFYNQVIEYHQDEFDYYFRAINRTQIRISNNNKTIDLYPKSEKFCRIPQNQWGLVGNDLEGFLKKEFA